MNGIDSTAGEFIYFGLKKWFREYFLSDFHSSSDIFLQFNVDGITLYNSSSKQFWPILCKVICKSNMYNPFCVPIYSDNSKPASSHDFFKEFIQEINVLMSEELIINEKNFKLKIGPIHFYVGTFHCEQNKNKFFQM